MFVVDAVLIRHVGRKCILSYFRSAKSSRGSGDCNAEKKLLVATFSTLPKTQKDPIVRSDCDQYLPIEVIGLSCRPIQMSMYLCA